MATSIQKRILTFFMFLLLCGRQQIIYMKTYDKSSTMVAKSNSQQKKVTCRQATNRRAKPFTGLRREKRKGKYVMTVREKGKIIFSRRWSTKTRFYKKS